MARCGAADCLVFAFVVALGLPAKLLCEDVSACHDGSCTATVDEAGMLQLERAAFASDSRSDTEQEVVNMRYCAATSGHSAGGSAMAISVASLNSFGLSLFQLLSSSSPQADVVISPLSVKVALSMVGAGTTECSQSEQEMAKVLGGFDPLVVNDAIELSNAEWIRGEIKDDYVDHVKTTYHAEALPLPGTDPAPINEWVKEKTHGRIAQLFVEPLDPLTVLVLVNTVFFKGAWAASFDPSRTRNGAFRTFSGEAMPCDMMYRQAKDIVYLETEQSQVVKLPYTSGGLSAIILLPKEDGQAALDRVIQSLTPELWETMAGQFRPKDVELSMPRFKADFSQKLNEALATLGMPTPFKGEEKGAFLRMTDDPLVILDIVMHQATLEVNEEGTVAAAATGAVMKTRSLPPRPVRMVVDRPFLFFVVDENASIMFASKICQPTVAGIGSKLS